MTDSTGSAALVAALKTAGADCVFGLPGTQNIDLFEALRRDGLRCVVPTSELAASMMASGYARAGARPAVLATIPGPGFTWALAGIAEASLDSVPVLHLTGAPATAPGQHFQLQAIDQRSMAAPLVRGSWRIGAAREAQATIAAAWRQTTADEPGPVLVEVAAGAWSEIEKATPVIVTQSAETAADLQVHHPRGGGDPTSLAGQTDTQSRWVPGIAARSRDDDRNFDATGESCITLNLRHPRAGGDPVPLMGQTDTQSRWVPGIAARSQDDDMGEGGDEVGPDAARFPDDDKHEGNTGRAAAGAIERIAARLAAARRCLLFVGQGGNACSAQVAQLAERLRAAVVTTTSGRGVVAEDHPLSLGAELSGYGGDALNALIETCDVVFALGCKFSHNGARGFSLRIPEAKLIHVDVSAQVPGANYPASIALTLDAGCCIEGILGRLGTASATHGFSGADIAGWRQRGLAELEAESRIEPHLRGTTTHTPGQFFTALRKAMPRDSHLVTDSGRHQDMARRHYRVLCPAGLITPTNFQSMGFSIAAATGACLAQPTRCVVAVLGDGGLAMAGLQLATAVELGLKLTVIVFVDGVYGAIRDQQLGRHGRASGTSLPSLDCAALAAAVGAHYVPLRGDAEAVLRKTLAAPGVKLVEVSLGDGLPLRAVQVKARVNHVLRGRIGAWLQRLLR